MINTNVSDSDYYFLKYDVKVGNVFKYKLVLNTDNQERSLDTDYKTVKSYLQKTFYYTKEVKNIDKSGQIEFDVVFDSVFIHEGNSEKSLKLRYNSEHCYRSKLKNIDSVEYLEFYTLVNEPFQIRVNKSGEIIEAFGFQQMYRNFYSIYNDTLNDKEKESVRNSFGEQDIMDILGYDSQILPDYGISRKTRSWLRKYSTELVYWEVENNALYKIIDEKDNIFNIDASLSTKVSKSEILNEDSVKIILKDFESKGRGTIVFDNANGCVVEKETVTELYMHIRLSIESDEGYSDQHVKTSVNVKLLK